MSAAHPLLRVFARNIDLLAFKRGLTRRELAEQLNITPYILSRVLNAQNRHLDPEIVSDLLAFFDCTPNDLLLPHADVTYRDDYPSG